MEESYRYYAQVQTDVGLEQVADALEACSWSIELCRSGYDGTTYLRTPLGSDEIDLEMASGQSADYLFGGGVFAKLARTEALLGELSELLAKAGLIHRIEIYGEEEDQPVSYLHFKWPETPAANDNEKQS